VYCYPGPLVNVTFWVIAGRVANGNVEYLYIEDNWCTVLRWNPYLPFAERFWGSKPECSKYFTREEEGGIVGAYTISKLVKAIRARLIAMKNLPSDWPNPDTLIAIKYQANGTVVNPKE